MPITVLRTDSLVAFVFKQELSPRTLRLGGAESAVSPCSWGCWEMPQLSCVNMQISTARPKDLLGGFEVILISSDDLKKVQIDL